MSPVIDDTFTPAPSGHNFTDAVGRVARFVKMPDDAEGVSLARDAVVDACAYFNHQVWKWALVAQDIDLTTPLVAAGPDYQVAVDFKEPRAVELLNTAGLPTGHIRHQAAKTFLNEHPVRSLAGTPSIYTVFNGHVYGILSFDKPPSAAFVALYPVARFWYYRRIAEPNVDSDDVIDVPNEAYHAICWKARALAAAIKRPDKMGLAEAEFERRWNLLIADHYDTTHDYSE